ncbi:MAG: hypothetical protein WDN46_12180 [Methylocella sp.]
MTHEPAEVPVILGRDGRPTRKRVGGPVALNARMVKMISLMIDGHSDDRSHTPYGLYDAAEAVGYRRKAARELTKSPVFIEAYNAAFDAAVANQSPPNPCPRLADVRVDVAWRDERHKLLQARRDADARCRRLEEELAEMRSAHPERPAFIRSANPGFIIRSRRSEAEASENE